MTNTMLSKDHFERMMSEQDFFKLWRERPIMKIGTWETGHDTINCKSCDHLLTQKSSQYRVPHTFPAKHLDQTNCRRDPRHRLRGLASIIRGVVTSADTGGDQVGGISLYPDVVICHIVMLRELWSPRDDAALWGLCHWYGGIFLYPPRCCHLSQKNIVMIKEIVVKMWFSIMSASLYTFTLYHLWQFASLPALVLSFVRGEYCYDQGHIGDHVTPSIGWGL